MPSNNFFNTSKGTDLSKKATSNTLVSTAIAMTSLTLLGQFAAVLRESIIAAKFGATSITDAYYLAIMIPNAFFLLVQNGLMMAFIPLLTQTLIKESEDRAWQMSSILINKILIAISSISLVIAAFADPIVSVLAPTLSLEMHMLTVRMLRILMSVSILGGLVALLSGILNVYRAYKIPRLFGLVLNGTMVIVIVLLADLIFTYTLVIATICAYLVQITICIFSLRKVQKYQFRIRSKDPLFTKVLQLSGPVVLTLIFQQIIVFVDRAVAVRLGIGNVAALNFATKLVLVGVPLISGAISTIMLPEMSRSVASNDLQHMKKFASTVLRYTIFIAFPIATLMFVLRQPIIFLVLQRGAFTEIASSLTADAMKFYTITLLGLSLRELTVRCFYALNNTHAPMLSGLLRMIVNLILIFILAPILGIGGIALASAIAVVLDVLVMLKILSRRWKISLDINFLLKLFLATGIVFVISSLSFHLTNNLEPISIQWIKQLISLVSSVFAGGFAYLGMCQLLKMNEAKLIFAFALSKISKRR